MMNQEKSSLMRMPAMLNSEMLRKLLSSLGLAFMAGPPLVLSEMNRCIYISKPKEITVYPAIEEITRGTDVTE